MCKRLHLRQKRSPEGWALLFVTFVFLLFVGYIVVRYRYFTYILREELFFTPMFASSVVLYVGLLMISVLLYPRLASVPVPVCALAVFFLALVARLAIRPYVIYEPQSDMAGYYQMGITFYNGDYSLIAESAVNYQIPDFVGLGVLFGLIAKVVGPGVLGFQLAFCTVTALSAMMVYLVAQTVHRPAAPIAGLLFAFYPANIIFSQVLTNQHLNVLFSLVSVFLLIYALRTKKIWLAALLALLSGLSLLVAQYAHPSTATTVVAFALYWLALLIGVLKRREAWLPLATAALAFALGLCGGRGLANVYFYANDLMNQEAQLPTCYLSKVVVGLNHDTQGMYSHEDYAAVASRPYEEQNAYCLSLIRERTADIPALLDLLDTKIRCLWMYKDTAFGWSIFGLEDRILAEREEGIDSPVREDFYTRRVFIQKAYNLLDFFYVAALYLFSFLGVLLTRGKKSAFLLLLLVPLGWMAIHLLSEVQTRYRYFAMPFFCMFAAMGIWEILRACMGKYRALKARRGHAMETIAGADANE